MNLKSRLGKISLYVGSFVFVAIVVIGGAYLFIDHASKHPEFEETAIKIISSITGADVEDLEAPTQYDSPDEAYEQEVIFYNQTLGLSIESTREGKNPMSGEEFIEYYDVPNVECTYSDLRIFVMSDILKHADCEHEFKIMTDPEDLIILYYEWGEVGELLCGGGNLYYWKSN